MIDERDLDAAVAAGVLDAGASERLVAFARNHRRGVAGADEEQFRLLTGFNDIFVTIAIGLVLFAVGSLGAQIALPLGGALVAAASWGLSEYFTRKRRMALPSIVLLLAFVGAVFGAGLTLGELVRAQDRDLYGWLVAASPFVAAWAAFLHWRRFKVPITIAAGVAGLGGGIVFVIGAITTPFVGDVVLLPLVFVLGLVAFGIAMVFDARDRARVTRWTDVAFWLHLLAAPAIIHPVFAMTGLLEASPSPGSAALVILVYLVLTIVALAIDRRALIVSALGYVIYAIRTLVETGGNLSLSFALTALVIGGFLVLLSAAWRRIRARVIEMLPAAVRGRVPAAD